MTPLLRRLNRWLHDPAPPERLAALRIAIGGFVTIYLIASVREFSRLTKRSPTEFEPVGLARLLSEPLSEPWVWVAFTVLLVVGAAFTAGVAVRATGPVFALLVLGWTSYHSSWGQLLHFEHLFTIHLLILAAAPTADVWAVGRRRSPQRVPSPDGRYGWPIRLLAIATAVTYLLSGIAKLKLSGAAWFETETLAAHIGYSTTRIQTVGGPTPPLARTVLENQWLIVPMATIALAVELGAVIALIGGRARAIWVLAAIGFHAATAATMLVFFAYRGLGFAMLPLFAVERLPEQMRTSFAQARRSGHNQ